MSQATLKANLKNKIATQKNEEIMLKSIQEMNISYKKKQEEINTKIKQ